MDLSEIINNLNSPDLATIQQAAQQLAKLNERAKPAAIGLCRLVDHQDETICEYSTAALENLGPPDLEDLPSLVELVTGNQSADVQYWAVTLLGRLEHLASHQASLLAAKLNDNSPLIVKQRIAWALAKLGNSGESVLLSLQQATQSADPRLARNAAKALACLK